MTTHQMSNLPLSRIRHGAAVAVVCLLTGLCAAVAGAQTPEAGVLDRAIDATVFIRTDHIYAGRGATSTGSGFLVGGDGWILTNEHVISDTIEVPVGNEWRPAKAKVMRVVVVLGSGTEHEAELEAKVVARDRDADLALLKIAGSYDAVVDPWSAPPPLVTDEIWLVGFPYGQLLAIERWQQNEIANPVASVNQGRISALRKGSDGSLRLLQTDAAVNPGNSGGPMINRSGQLLGVVSSKVGSDGIGFAVAGEQVREFLLQKGYRVSFLPPMITDATTNLQVQIQPGLIDLSTVRGKVTVSGGSSAGSSAALRPRGRGLQATIPLEASAADAAAEGLLRARIEIAREGQGSAARIFRLRGQSSQRRARHTPGDSESDDAEASEVLQTTSAPAMGLSGGKFGAARTTGGGESTGIVISDSLMAKIHEFRFADEYYEELPTAPMRELAERYERTYYALYRAVVHYGQRDRRKVSQGEELKEEVERLIHELRVMQKELMEEDMCRCGVTWVICGEAECRKELDKPWIDPDLLELRDLIN